MTFQYKIETALGSGVFHAVDHVQLSRFAAVLCLSPSSGMVFTTINTHGDVISLLRERPSPHTPCGFILQIFDAVNFLVARKHRETPQQNVWEEQISMSESGSAKGLDFS